MRRVLLTGMSGTGKSSVIRELAQALEDQRMFQPLLRDRATMVIDTSAPTQQVVDAILARVGV